MLCIGIRLPKHEKRPLGWSPRERALLQLAVIRGSGLVRVSLIFYLLRAFLRLVGSLVRSFLSRMLHRVTRVLCAFLRGSAGVFGSILRCVPRVFNVLFRALLVLWRSSQRSARQGSRQE